MQNKANLRRTRGDVKCSYKRGLGEEYANHGSANTKPICPARLVFTRYQIMDPLHGGDYVVTGRAIDVQIACLRKKLGPWRDCIETVRGVGYRFKDQVQA